MGMLSGKPVNSSAKMTSTVYVLIDTYVYNIECYEVWGKRHISYQPSKSIESVAWAVSKQWR